MNYDCPKFIGIGAQRAATTWIHDCLCRHPDLYLPDVKEVHFFDENFDQGWEWYMRHFDDRSNDQIAGEITPNYLDVESAAQRIALSLPKVKMFAILREPVARAISSYELLGHKFSERSFEDACRPGKYLVELGLYAKHLKRFYEHFDHDQIRVYLLEDLRKDPKAFMGDLLRFIGAEECDLVEREQSQTNSVSFPRTQEWLESVGLRKVIDFTKRSPLSGAVRKGASFVKRRRSKMYDRAKIQEYFRDDILELEKLIDRDLSSWLR